tara:strand:+ start:382 stop:837 length:456 start_codon:yes stop_codon:yes gene_type:complete
MICLVSFFYYTSWEIYKNILGWPSFEELPERFKISWVVILEPDKKNNKEGEIFLWIRDIDSFEFGSAKPRAYQLNWNEENHKKAQEALHKLKEGEQLNGRKSYGVLNQDNESKKSNPYDAQEGDPEQGRPSFEFIEVPPPDLPPKTLILDQ